MRYWTQLASEQFPPSDLVRQAVEAEAAGFDGAWVSDQSYIVSSDPKERAERIREVEKLGATVVCLQNASGADPHAALRVYGEQVLPTLTGARV